MPASTTFHRSRPVRGRPEFDDVHGDGALARVWNAVSGKCVADIVPRTRRVRACRQRIEDDRQRASTVKRLTKVAVPLLGGRDCVEKLDRATLANSLVIAEEERTVLDNRAAERRAELVALELSASHLVPIVLPTVGIQVIITEELVSNAMIFVGTGLGHDVHDAAAGSPVFGGVGSGIDAEFSHRLKRHGEGLVSTHHVAAFAAIGQQSVLGGEAAAHSDAGLIADGGAAIWRYTG